VRRTALESALIGPNTLATSYPIASAAEIQAAREANTLTSLPRPFVSRNKGDSGFISGPLVASAPRVSDNPMTGATPEFAAAASPPDVPPVQRSPMPPRYESNPDESNNPKPQSTPLPNASPLTPLGTVVPPTDPLLVLVVDDDAVTRVLSSKCVHWFSFARDVC
jgi:hypothetical protein